LTPNGNQEEEHLEWGCGEPSTDQEDNRGGTLVDDCRAGDDVESFEKSPLKNPPLLVGAVGATEAAGAAGADDLDPATMLGPIFHVTTEGNARHASLLALPDGLTAVVISPLTTGVSSPKPGQSASAAAFAFSSRPQTAPALAWQWYHVTTEGSWRNRLPVQGSIVAAEAAEFFLLEKKNESFGVKKYALFPEALLEIDAPLAESTWRMVSLQADCTAICPAGGHQVTTDGSERKFGSGVGRDCSAVDSLDEPDLRVKKLKEIMEPFDDAVVDRGASADKSGGLDAGPARHCARSIPSGDVVLPAAGWEGARFPESLSASSEENSKTRQTEEDGGAIHVTTDGRAVNLFCDMAKQAVEADSSAGADARSFLLLKNEKDIFGEGRYFEIEDEPETERLSPQVERASPKVERLSPKVERLSPKAERLSSIMDIVVDFSLSKFSCVGLPGRITPSMTWNPARRGSCAKLS
jgi:hypothetical protein